MRHDIKITGDEPFVLQVLDDDTVTASYPLREVSRRELAFLRASQQPGIVYKKEKSLYYSAIPEDLKIVSATHLCGNNCSMVCRGCPKTSALTVAHQMSLGKKFSEAVIDSWRIEKYLFIAEGVESFNTQAANDAFIVIKCNAYKTYGRQ